MFPIWLMLGSVLVLAGIFNKQMMRWLGINPMSEIITSSNLKKSSKMVEQFGRWLVITLGLSFLVIGLGGVLPDHVSDFISFLLLGLSGLLFLAMIGISIATWRAK